LLIVDCRLGILDGKSEASETQYWLEVIVEIGWLTWNKVKAEYEECSELLAIFTSIGKSK